MKLLLDTCTFLWYLTGSRELPGDVVERIRHSGNQVSLSAVSFWEIVFGASGSRRAVSTSS